jgi:hypothetical protein
MGLLDANDADGPGEGARIAARVLPEQDESRGLTFGKGNKVGEGGRTLGPPRTGQVMIEAVDDEGGFRERRQLLGSYGDEFAAFNDDEAVGVDGAAVGIEEFGTDDGFRIAEGRVRAAGQSEDRGDEDYEAGAHR